MQPILEISGISKHYKVGERERYLSLRDAVGKKIRQLKTFASNGKNGTTDTFWALKDVSFNVHPGESIGIIGRNGAGKSTLLKILSRITPPTAGSIICRGRIASLLEVGTGFHPELTGRENIFMNGSILGMKRAEIRKQFDAIVDFSGIERFLDTPLKRYSSGMQLRLAFAVAAHLEPEILVIDEVLAVGDAEFQKKCLGKMNEVARSGRTILFVSHDLTAVRTLTSKCVYLRDGKIELYDATEKAISRYLKGQVNLSGDINISGTHCRLIRAQLMNQFNQQTNIYNIDEPVRIELKFSKDQIDSLSVELFLKDDKQTKIAIASLSHFEHLALPKEKGIYASMISLNQLPLASGKYFIDIAISIPKIGWDLYAENAVSFEVLMCNPRHHSWDLKQEFGYGTLAWLLTEKPKFIPDEVAV
jgi:lipopolysaccharide transport system ATP-binding protein